ncbi:MAG: cytochrome P450 [Gammaproteobacteria bacterium]|nr:cytochrome P450 [Gammaproteobacteria bacterium]
MSEPGFTALSADGSPFFPQPNSASEIPVFGSAFKFGRDPLNFLLGLALESPITHFHLGKMPVYLLQHPELIGEVLRSKSDVFEKSDFADELRQIIGNGLVTSQGDEWLKHRKIVSPVIQKRQLEHYTPLMAGISRQHAKNINAGLRNVHDDIMSLAMQIITDTLFKTDAHVCPHTVSHSLEQALTHFHTLALGWQRILPKSLPTHARREYKKVSLVLDKIVSSMLDAYEANPEGQSPLFNVLLKAHREGNISRRQIIDEALTMFLAGHETTALAVSYALYLIASDDNIQQRLFAEVNALGDRLLTSEDMDNLKLTTAVINESLRLYPPIWSIIRRTTQPYRLGSIDLKPGDHLMISQWTLSREPSWFPEPDRFNPDRWLQDKQPPRFAFIPFGAGGRKCIGDQFAMIEATLMLAEFVRHAHFSRSSNHPLELVPSVTLRPKRGVWLNVNRRIPCHVQEDKDSAPAPRGIAV